LTREKVNRLDFIQVHGFDQHTRTYVITELGRKEEKHAEREIEKKRKKPWSLPFFLVTWPMPEECSLIPSTKIRPCSKPLDFRFLLRSVFITLLRLDTEYYRSCDLLQVSYHFISGSLLARDLQGERRGA
jgi:hypothetical protein